MLAAHDQENRLIGHSLGGASGKQQALQPKTPGAKFPKTPLKKMPFNDQNGATRLAAGRSVLGGRLGGGIENMQQTVGKAGKAGVLATPREPRTVRAPLGNKTTNAKAQTLYQHQQQQLQKQGVKERIKEIEKSAQQAQPTSTRRARVISPRVNPSKLSVLNDKRAGGRGDRDNAEVEYAPPPVVARPFESDVFPNGALTFAAFRPANRLRGYYDHYYNPVDANGLSRRDKELAEKQQRAFEKLDICVQDDLNSLDWSIGDVPASKGFVAKQKQTQTQTTGLAKQAPATIAVRNAAAALALGAKSGPPQSKVGRPAGVRTAATAASSSSTFVSGLPLRKGLPAKSVLAHRPKTSHYAVAETASRTTLGYTKGRTALSLVRGNTVAGRPPAGRSAVTARPRTAGGVLESGSSAAVTPVYKAEMGAVTTEEVVSMGADDDDGDASTRTPAFVSIFDVEEESGELGGAGTVINDDLDDDFQLDVQF
ncbi:hypothetical protein CMQ_3363 [Grosmannia clavigera kw1407]|uniref:Uncharacterized protein n=1 Tax=Grosmannia clavigera (strain kw1407 / UAMH 11150) TaxID=655863 RepID=F0XA91_GROCL|nr:uncharacterized protein CMQ_3363 [Grosmannia clavigera kw1407]EFX05294.1 hypothetical protein CMQ_3363 [Grosmannia clavigera kw1407]